MSWLTANDNQITSLPSNFFAELDKLQLLFLNGNQLTSLQGVGLDKLREVWEMNISDNRLTKLPDDFVTAFLGDATSSTRETDGFCLIKLYTGGNPFSASWQSTGKLKDFLSYFGTYDPRSTTNSGNTGSCDVGILFGGNRSNFYPYHAADIEALGLAGIDMSPVVTGTTKSSWDFLLDDFVHTDSNDALDRFTYIYDFSFGWKGLNVNDAMLDKLPVKLEQVEVEGATFDNDISSATGEGFDRFDAHASGPWLSSRLLPIETATNSVSWGASANRGDGLQILRLDNVGLNGDGSDLLGKLNHDKMRWLEIVNNPGLTGISSHIKSMTKLRGLQIEHNNVTSVGADAFDGLGELVYLGLGSNAIDSVHEDAFDSLAKLVVLLLNENKIDSLASGTLNDAVLLENLWLQDNDLAGLPVGFFKGLTKMEQVDLSNNLGTPFQIGVNVIVKPGDPAERMLTAREAAPFDFWVDVLDSSKARTTKVKFTRGLERIPFTSSFVLPENGSVKIMDTLPSWPGNNNYWCLGYEECLLGYELKLNPPARLIDVRVTSYNDALRPGDVIVLSAYYDEVVTVTGTPTMTFDLGGATRAATYKSGTGTTTLTFEYVIVREDGGLVGISTRGALSLPSGASIVDSDGNNATRTAHSAHRTYDATVFGDRILISRIEPTIRGVTLRGGEKVRLTIDVYGVQNSKNNSLAENIVLNWDDGDAGGSFDGTGTTTTYTAPSIPGNYIVMASLIPAYCKEDTTTDAKECSASFDVSVKRPAAPQPEDEPPVNPATVPSILTDGSGNQYEVFTPVEGGTFNPGEGYWITAQSGDVPNGEVIGIRMSDDGSASNLGMTHQRYTLGGNMYGIHVVDGAGSSISSYVLDDPVQVCLPLPAALSSNISKVALVAMNSDGTLTILSSSVKLGSSGTSVCGNISTLPASVAVGHVGSPAAIPTATPEPTPAPPPTGATAPSNTNGILVWAILLGLALTGAGAVLAITRRRKNVTPFAS